jgi:dinuclear metal center YbgI/SA1388 family protein
VATSTIAQLLEALAESIPFSKGDRGDPVGLQIGDPQQAVRRVAICHEVTDAVVEAAQRERVELLIAYHPLLYAPLRALVAGPQPGGRALRLAAERIALAVVHTCFDVAEGGAAAALADAFELEDVSGFAPLRPAESVKIATFLPEKAADGVLDAVVGAGAARIGNYTHCSFRSAGEGTFFAASGTRPTTGRAGALNRELELRLEFVAPREREAEVVAALLAAHPYEEPAYDVVDRRGEAGLVGRIGRCEPGTRLGALAERAREILGTSQVRAAGDPKRELAQVAVIPGSGVEFAAAARAAGADVLITGDWTHHRTRAALDAGLAVIDPGHVPTERPGLQRLFTRVASLGRASVSLLDVDPDPWWS